MLILIIQVAPVIDHDLHRLNVYLRFLLKKIDIESPRGVDITDKVLLEYYKLEKKTAGTIYLDEGEDGGVEIGDPAGGKVAESEADYLSSIIAKLNERYGTSFSESEKLAVKQIRNNLRANEELELKAKNNSYADFKYAFEPSFLEGVMQEYDKNQAFYGKILRDVGTGVEKISEDEKLEGVCSMTSEETERICFNCNYFFPSSEEVTEYGICLEDNDFDPYIEDLLEDFNFASCQDLIDKKQFLGENDGCEKFEEIEMLEIDDDSPLGELLNHFRETGEIELGQAKKAMLEEQLKNIDWKTLPVNSYVEKLEKGDKEEQKKVLRNLGSLSLQGNREAFEVLLNYLKVLPPPEKIEEVHIKIDILEDLKRRDAPDQRSRLISLLVEELYKVASNNTTRQWITKILQYLARAPEAEVRQPLETLLKERKFSFRMRGKIEAVLDQLGQEDYYGRE